MCKKLVRYTNIAYLSALSASTLLCALSTELFIPVLTSWGPGTAVVPSVSVELTLDDSCEWIYAVFVLLRVSCFTQHYVLRVHMSWPVSEIPSFLRLRNIPSYGSGTLCVSSQWTLE